jgi:hypothetical protein
MKNLILKLVVAILFFFSFFGKKIGAQPVDPNSGMMTLAGDSSTRFHSLFRLSDGTFLVGGKARSLSWLPSSVAPTTLSMPGSSNSKSTMKAFILHLSSDLKTIVHAVKLPDSTVQNVFKIKTNSAPFEPTGDIFISGSRQNELNQGNGIFPGYYLAKLNGNFLNGNVPTGLVFIYDVACRNFASTNTLSLQLHNLMGNFNQYK